MTDKEKMKEFENWLKCQTKEVFEGYIEADESGNRTAVLVKEVAAIVLLQVLNQFRAIERREDEKI
ncbi:MAG: hypothetical protein E6293_09025 [Dialister sp.]|nr:hypothetical protein [Dialister sp.]